LTALNELSLNPNLGISKINPNPSFGMIEISFKIHQKDFIDLRLIDESGKEITILPYKNFSAGEHKFQFDTSNIPSGMYYLKLIASTFIDSKKIIIY